MTIALVLAAALAVACVLAVAFPFLREPEPQSDALGEIDEPERRRLALLEERDRALAALKELEFDHRTGAVSDEDYRALVGPLRRDVASALQALERDSEATGESPVRRTEPTQELGGLRDADPPQDPAERDERVGAPEEGRPAAERTS